MPSPPAISVFTSNRAEVLAARLAEVLAQPVGGPFEPEWIMVQSHGMATWLSLQLAEHHGIFAHGEFLFPRRVVDRAHAAVLGDAEPDPPGRDAVLWAVLASLPAVLPDRRFARLRRYLGDDPRGVRRGQLAQRIARVFDQYLTYRPELVHAWEAGEDRLPDGAAQEAWQPELWRQVAARLPASHAASRERAFLAAARGRDTVPAGLPPRLTVFGVSTLPPLYVRALVALAPCVDVHLFALSPCEEYWLDLLEPRDAARRAAAQADAPLEDLHLDVGHPLLASMGTLGAEFATVLMDTTEAAGVAEEREEVFVPPEGDGALARLQRGLLRLDPGPDPDPERVTRPRRAAGHPMLPFADRPPSGAARHDPADRSLTVHACHGPMREVEVLHDQLLAMLDQDPTLLPRDIVVMMSDVEAYAPLVEAVFARDAQDPLGLPFRIADRTLRGESPVVEVLQRVLAMVGGRAPASEVLDLLRLRPVRDRFALLADDLEPLSRWVAEAGVRSGIDARHHAQLGQPALDANTWSQGLLRMLLGYAMPGEGRSAFAGVLPYDEIEGLDAARLGQLVEFANTLFGWLRRLEEPRTVPAWRDTLAALLDALLQVAPEDEWQVQRVRDALHVMAEEAAAAGYEDTLDIAVLRSWIEPRLDEAHAERGFLGAGISFCAFVPMRSIPFRVVAMLGMGDGAFPRQDRPVDFDLMAGRRRRPGDRSRRADDRYLFLEALLSARDALLITYSGQSIRDNEELPPAVVVAELLDAVAAAYGEPKLGDRLVTRHALQPFSRRYFDGGDARLFSYQRDYLGGAERLTGERRPPPPLFTGPLPPDREEGGDASEVRLDDLVRFFGSPAAYLLNRRLQVYLREDALAVEDAAPLALAPLQRYQVGARALELRRDGMPAEQVLALERGHGLLPVGGAGAFEHHRVLWSAEAISRCVATLGDAGGVVAVRLPLEGGRLLTGALTGIGAHGQVVYQFSRVAAKHQLAAWLRHLTLCAVAQKSVDRRSWLVGRPASDGKDPVLFYRFDPVAEPGPLLAELVRLFDLGQRAPLRFTPPTSLAFAERARAWGEDSALRSVVSPWLGTKRPPDTLYDDHAYRLFGRSEPPFEDVPTEGPGFTALAMAVFGPLLDHRHEGAD